MGVRDGAGREIEIKLRVTDVASMERRLRRLGARRGTRAHEVNAVFDTPEQALRRKGQLLRVRVERPAGRRGHGADRARRERPGTNRGADGPALPAEGVGRGKARVERLVFPPGRVQKAVVTLKTPIGGGAGDRIHGERERRRGGTGYKVRREIEVAVEDAVELRRVLGYLGYQPAFFYEKIRTEYRLPGLKDVVVTLDETPIGMFLELEGAPREIDRARQLLGYRPDEAILLSYGGLYAAHQRALGQPFRHMVFA